jgi:peptidoglycan/xylan/chitin deacetylase (PgdA/CDA1 family)
MLHGVMDEHEKAEWTPIRTRTSRKALRDTLALSSRYLNFISLDDAVDMLSGNISVTNNACVVTFDDGQLNNYVCAIPILKEFSVPCTLYPSTRVVDEQSTYWFDRLDYAIQQPGLHDTTVTVNNHVINIDQTTRRSISSSLSLLIKTLKKEYHFDHDFQKHVSLVCEDLENRSGKKIDQLENRDLWSAAMTWDEIAECSKSENIIIGSHTVNHVRLSIADSGTIRDELIKSKNVIESHTGRDCKHFCYPNGDWNLETKEIAKETGYISAVTTDTGLNSLDSDPYELKRISFPDNGSSLYGLFAVTGFFATYATLKEKLFALLKQ